MKFCVMIVVLLVAVVSSPFDSSAQLARQWISRFSGNLKGGNNTATAMTVDASGNILVAGWVTRKTTGIDIAVIKYSPDGVKLHEAYLDGGSNREDKAKAIAVDSGNNVYITGWSDGGPSTGFDFITVKYDSNLIQVWMKRYNGPGNGEDKAIAVAVNDSLNVYVTGWSTGSGSNTDYATIKYLSNGDTAWVQRYNGPGNGADVPAAMALRGTLDLYITGTSVDTTNDFTTIKYSASNGSQHWVTRTKGPGADNAHAILLRSSTDVYVTGGSQNSLGNYDYLTVKYDSAGVEQWTSRYDSPIGGDDEAYAIALQSTSGSARLYVTGRSLGIGTFNDFVTLRLSQSNGTVNWSSIYNGSGNDDDTPVALLGGGNPIVVGSSTGLGVGKDIALVEYTGTNGNEQFSHRYNGPANSDDIPSATVSSSGGTYIAGSSMSSAKGSDWIVIKYVDAQKLKYRTFSADSLGGKGVSLKLPAAIPTIANVRDTAFGRAYPKIKKGFPNYPGGLVLGNARPDAPTTYGWIRFDKGSAIQKFMPQTGTARGFDLLGAKLFVGEVKNPKTTAYNNHLVGQLVALRINIGASDAEVTPPTFGDLTYQNADTVNGVVLTGMSLRQIASLTDNLLTYWKQYPPINWPLLDTVLTHINKSFVGPLGTVTSQPLVVTGALLIDSVAFLQPGAAPLQDPLAFAPGSLDIQVPTEYTLYQNYPNPFNPTTTIEFDLPEQSLVTLKVYDILGREVATLLDQERMDEGRQEVDFNANALASGVYFYRVAINEGHFSQVKKMVLLR